MHKARTTALTVIYGVVFGHRIIESPIINRSHVVFSALGDCWDYGSGSALPPSQTRRSMAELMANPDSEIPSITKLSHSALSACIDYSRIVANQDKPY